jgi:2,4-dienoyl-CoA reductase-like NADH-dependent reductase (Old Yellow Enzyme family)
MTRSRLFTPFRVGGLELRNRIVIAPMCQYSADEGRATDWHVIHLGHLAHSGAALLTIEATAVLPEGRISARDLGLWSDDTEAALSRTLESVRRWSDMPIAIQLAHAGRKASVRVPWQGGAQIAPGEPEGWQTEAPSALAFAEGQHPPRALDRDGLARVRDAFAGAARRAARLGLDAVQIHGAHGYLLHEFLSPLSNTRDDAYGGSLENRMRFPLAVAKAVREAWPAGKPLFVRCSSIDDVEGGWSLDDTVQLAKQLKAAGVDVIDCSSGGILGSATAAQKTTLPRVPGFQLPFAERVRKEAGLKTMAVGLILSAQQAEEALEAGRADLIAIGREALYDPNWPVHAARELGVDPDYALWPQQYGWWLTRRQPLLDRAGVKR